MSGRKRKNDFKTQKGNVEYCNNLIKFYARFDSHDFENDREEIKNKLEKRLKSVNKRIVFK